MEGEGVITSLLFSHKKLDRDRGVNELEVFLTNCATAEDVVKIQNDLVAVLKDRDSGKPWECIHGSLLGCSSLILYKKKVPPDARTIDFFEDVRALCLVLLEHDEVRIRLAAGKVLGSLCIVQGPEVYEKCRETVLELIKANFERESMDTDDDVFDNSSDSPEMYKTHRRRLSSDASKIFHDTAGWRFLETSMNCLRCMIEGFGEKFKPYIQEDLLELLFRCLTHANRFVRETGYYVIGSLVSCGTTCDENRHNPFTAENFGHHVAKALGRGLGDNWSQVRLASSEGARKFLMSFKTDEEKEVFFPDLLPKMCLNRYYVAEGVRIYSQESWKLIAKDNGRALVKKYIVHFVDYYIEQTKANNHAVREAACACIAELALKIDQEAVKPHVEKLLETLLECFKDESWPVRDAACLACGNFVLCYPNESRGVMALLYPLFFENLKDPIPSVRQGAAGALSNVVKAFGKEAYEMLVTKIKEGLTDVKNQPSESQKYGQLDKSPATFSLVKRLRDNDMELHTDKQMYSCGSLAPKMGRGGGCSDHKFKKPSEPWEFADGCVHLIAELCQVPEVSANVTELFPLLIAAANIRHYTHHVCLLESLCKQLPNIAKGLGKKVFKQHLEMFLGSVFYTLTCENILASSAAAQCLSLLSEYLGPNIFKSRVEMFNPNYLHMLDECLQPQGSKFAPT